MMPNQQRECFMAAGDLTAQRLRELLDYAPGTGAFTWRPRPTEMFRGPRAGPIWHTRYCGKRAGHVNRIVGYESIRIFDRSYWSHRLAWLHVYGEWPVGEVDHINGDRLDNRIANLRACDRQVNAQNMRRRPKDDGVLLGVHRVVTRNLSKPFTAKIYVSGRSHHLGYFATEAQAHAAYLDAKRRLHRGCTI